MASKVFSMKRNFVSAIALATAMLAPASAMAEEVTLRSADGTVNLVGDFIEFTDNNYVIRTGLGDLRISASRVRCEGAACPSFETAAEADVTLSGSDTVGLGVMPLLMSGYAAYLNAEVTTTELGAGGEVLAEMIGDEGFGDPVGNFLIRSTGSSDGFANLLGKSAQVAMSSRRIRVEEARALRDAGAGNMVSPDQEHILAIDSLVVITHPSNPIDTLSVQQLAGIYSGAITNWSEVGGENAPITVLTRDETSGTRGVFDERVLGEGVSQTGQAFTISDNNAMAATVNDDPNAIGYVGYAFQRGAKPLTLINECGQTMVPDAFSARTEEYALQRFLYLYNRADTNISESENFVDYAVSNAADEVIAKAGFIDLGIDRRAQTMDDPRAQSLLDPNVDAFEGGVMREMLAQMVNYDRLSSTFRFRTGSQNLDQRGLLNLERLTDYLETQPEGTEVLIVGFTDDVGAFESNRELSVRRAESVRATLRDFAGDRLNGITVATAGYGEIAPATCNITEGQRSINRRVEVWIQSPA